MMKLLLCSCAVLLCGCSGQLGKTTSHFDKVEAVQIHQLSRNNVAHTPFAQTVLYVNARCETKPGGKEEFFIYTEMIAPPDFVLQPSDSLVLNVDGSVHRFSPTNSPTGFTGRKRYITTFYSISPEVLAKLAEANEAWVRVRGQNKVIDKRLSRRNLAHFHEFAKKRALAQNSGGS